MTRNDAILKLPAYECFVHLSYMADYQAEKKLEYDRQMAQMKMR